MLIEEPEETKHSLAGDKSCSSWSEGALQEKSGALFKSLMGENAAKRGSPRPGRRDACELPSS